LAYALVGLLALAAAAHALRTGSVEVPLRFVQVVVHRRGAPVRYWLIILVYLGVAMGLLTAAWRLAL
jgi:hypothetical protein